MSAESDVIARRVLVAIENAEVGRVAVMEDWPECHRKGCQGSHPDPGHAYGTMKARISDAVRMELDYHETTRPDVAEPEDSPEDTAVYTLAILLSRYNVRDTSTFVKAARLMVEAYPALVPALTETPDLGTTEPKAKD